MEALLPLGVAVACAIYCSRVARANGGSAAVWFIAGLCLSLLGVLLVHLLTQQKKLACPMCASAIEPGSTNCQACGHALPDAYSLTTLVNSETVYNGECASCATPYRLSDYREDATEIRCSRCGATFTRESEADAAV